MNRFHAGNPPLCATASIRDVDGPERFLPSAADTTRGCTERPHRAVDAAVLSPNGAARGPGFHPEAADRWRSSLSRQLRRRYGGDSD